MVGMLVSKLTSSLVQLRHAPRTLELVWAASRKWSVAWVILLLVQGLLPVATVFLVKLLVDGITEAIGQGGRWESVQPIVLYGALMGLVMVVSELLRGAINYVRGVQSELLTDHISSLIHQKSIEVDLAFYESADFYDHLHRARDEAGYRPVTLLENMGSVLQNSITLLAMGAVLIPFGLWLPVALFLSTLPALYVVLRHAVRQHEWRLRTTSDERRSWYYDWLMTTGDTAAELRLFGLGDHFKTTYQSLRRRLRGEKLKLARDQGLAELGAGAVGLVITGAAMAWMVWRALLGLVTLGDLALFYQAFNQGQRLMRSLLDNVGQIYYNSLFLGNLFEFLGLASSVERPASGNATTEDTEMIGRRASRPAIVHPEGADQEVRVPLGQAANHTPHTQEPRISNLESRIDPTINDQRSAERNNSEYGIRNTEFPGAQIRFEKVSFRYPGCKHWALKDFSLELGAGRTTAIVGSNGAGKSTLIKLICRFYDPDKGVVRLDGVDLRELDLDQLRRSITVLFQEPVHYNHTVKENIGFGDIQREVVRREIEAAAEAAGADRPIAGLPHGYETLLGKWFETGAELSVGEWQRIALARAFLRKAPILLLDEPTSAMDSWAETEWLDRLRENTDGQTVLLITHRFTTAMRADVIHVMEDGGIVESGSHAELLDLRGRYSESWRRQVGIEDSSGRGSRVESRTPLIVQR